MTFVLLAFVFWMICMLALRIAHKLKEMSKQK